MLICFSLSCKSPSPFEVILKFILLFMTYYSALRKEHFLEIMDCARDFCFLSCFLCVHSNFTGRWFLFPFYIIKWNLTPQWLFMSWLYCYVSQLMLVSRFCRLEHFIFCTRRRRLERRRGVCERNRKLFTKIRDLHKTYTKVVFWLPFTHSSRRVLYIFLYVVSIGRIQLYTFLLSTYL